MKERGFYSEKEVVFITTLSPVTIWRKRREGEFPNPISISKGRIGYPVAAVNKWVDALMEGYPDAA